jgi:hypothetical protein
MDPGTLLNYKCRKINKLNPSSIHIIYILQIFLKEKYIELLVGYHFIEVKKMKNKYHTVGTISKFNRKIVDMSKIDTLDTHNGQRKQKNKKTNNNFYNTAQKTKD